MDPSHISWRVELWFLQSSSNHRHNEVSENETRKDRKRRQEETEFQRRKSSVYYA